MRSRLKVLAVVAAVGGAVLGPTHPGRRLSVRISNWGKNWGVYLEVACL